MTTEPSGPRGLRLSETPNPRAIVAGQMSNRVIYIGGAGARELPIYLVPSLVVPRYSPPFLTSRRSKHVCHYLPEPLCNCAGASGAAHICSPLPFHCPSAISTLHTPTLAIPPISLDAWPSRCASDTGSPQYTHTQYQYTVSQIDCVCSVLSLL
ncbi:hypothetical protein FIBSPDRAFT_603318 [Athelia psychrophila]|uniref:Uncharacterized protein n=1 Tax=Athelia psychrophila TaxID=1759441 RepID=A0A166GQY4_9AGAM|nr:hypothetical protein FIBSPDRAFT_603318 [Fibularhizoctonia sp. CBS 109695]